MDVLDYLKFRKLETRQHSKPGTAHDYYSYYISLITHRRIRPKQSSGYIQFTFGKDDFLQNTVEKRWRSLQQPKLHPSTVYKILIRQLDEY